MKLLIFAHTPPPHHGQSYMVQLMLEGFGGDRRKTKSPISRENEDTASSESVTPNSDFGIECYHVNARLSKHLEDIGDMRVGKFVFLLGYCLQAIWCRFRYGVTNLYYIPAPGKRSALYRDWFVMFLCRRFFPRVILHWHAAGLAGWLETVVQMRSRSITYRLMKHVDLSIILSQYNQADAEKIFSQNIKVISNGIPDPCPNFKQELLPRRRARFVAHRKLLSGASLNPEDIRGAGPTPEIVQVLYVAHCTREKGLFDTLAGLELASRQWAERQFPLRLRLLVAGSFVSAEEKAEFDRIMARPGMSKLVEYFGFVSGDQKHRLLSEADLFCFPTYYENENQPVNLIEAMAFGLPILTTRWRSIPELFPAGYSGLVDIRSPEQIAEVIPALMTSEAGDRFRDMFLRTFTMQRHLSELAQALYQLERSGPEAQRQPALQPVHCRAETL